MKLVTIIIPVYNVENYLKKCLETIEEQSYKNIEIIFIDDGSTDGSGKILDLYANQHSNAVVYHKDNNGVSSARNFGLEKMSREGYVVFIDPDDYIEKTFVEKLVDEAEMKPKDLVTCGFFRQNEDGRIINIDNNKIYSDKYCTVLENNKVSGYVWNKIFDKKIIYNYGIKFDENICLCEDLCFVIDYVKHVNKIFIINLDLYHYIQHSISAVNFIFDKEKLNNEIDALKKIYDAIPEKYENAKKMAYIKLFYHKIHYWIKMYKSGKFEKINDYQKIDLVTMKKNIKQIAFKYKVYYFGVLYLPKILFNIIFRMNYVISNRKK